LEIASANVSVARETTEAQVLREASLIELTTESLTRQEMRLFPERFRTRLQNKLWRVITKPAPRFSEFASDVTNEFRSTYQGRAADIFFSNKDETVHKWLHFLPIYDKIFLSFANSKVKFLEIGVAKGGSLRVWRTFFGKNAVIYGIDINKECAIHDGQYANVRIGSQDDPSFLKRVVDEMGGLDLVLDDGSHIASHQSASFNFLFPLLGEGGLYVIEDLHTAYWPAFEGGLRRPGTAIELLKNKIDEIHRHYYIHGLNRLSSMPDIESIQFFDSIAVIAKRKQLPRGAPRNESVPSILAHNESLTPFDRVRFQPVGFCRLASGSENRRMPKKSLSLGEFLLDAVRGD
jgi:hypothetical protein